MEKITYTVHSHDNGRFGQLGCQCTHLRLELIQRYRDGIMACRIMVLVKKFLGSIAIKSGASVWISQFIFG